MGLAKKDEVLKLKRSEFELFCLIKEGILGHCTHLIDEEENKEFLKSGEIAGKKNPFAPIFALKEESPYIKKAKKGQSIKLSCEGKIVGELTLKSKFKPTQKFANAFNPNICYLENSGKVCISGEFEIYNSHIKKLKQEFEKQKARLNAKNVTAMVASFDPLHRGHERIFRWSVDKADLVVVFLIESYEDNGFEFDLKLKCLQTFVQKYLPPERIFIFPLKHLDIFSEHLNPLLEIIVAKSLKCKKLIVGQNHTGLGMFYDFNQPKTILDEFAKDYGIEVLVLPEFVFCNRCKMLVSIKSCPHGSQNHIKFKQRSLKDLLRMGILPPPVFIRREISELLLSHLFPNRFKNMQKLYNDLFATDEIVEDRADSDFYEQLLNLYRYMV